MEVYSGDLQSSISPNVNHSSRFVLLRRYRESHLTKWGVPPGWGCGVGKLKEAPVVLSGEF